MNKDILDLGKAQYEHVVGLDEMERDSDGFILLKPSAKRADEKKATLTTDISNLEAKLKQFKAEREKINKYQKSDDYKESKKRLSKKKAKKQRENLLEMVFNNADHANDDDEDLEDDEDGTYRDKKQKAPRKKNETTLETTYGKRFSPVVAMLHEAIVEFDNIAISIENELADTRNSAKSMYRSTQLGNLISAKNSKLSAVKELASVAKTVSDLEYKKEKDKQAQEGADSTKAISAIGAKFLRGGLDALDSGSSKGKKKKDDKSSSKKSSGSKLKYNYDEDDDDEETGSIKSAQRRDVTDQRELAAKFAESLSFRKDDIKLSPHERFISMEGKYNIIVSCDPTDPDDTWKFVAVDSKTGKEIKGFKDDYPGLLPKKRNCKMVFDLSKNKATDKNSSRTYKLVYKD